MPSLPLQITTESMAYLVEYSSGVVCIAMEGRDLDRLRLPLMVSSAENEECMYTAFTITVDLKEGVSTGGEPCMMHPRTLKATHSACKQTSTHSTGYGALCRAAPSPACQAIALTQHYCCTTCALHHLTSVFTQHSTGGLRRVLCSAICLPPPHICFHTHHTTHAFDYCMHLCL